MSFSSEQKSAIIEKNSKSACCRRALLHGALFAKAHMDGDEIVLSVERREYAAFIAKLIKEFYGKEPTPTAASVGGRRYIISFTSQSAANYLRSITNTDNFFVEKCEGCQSAFLKGVFLVSGRIADPNEAYSIHFTLGDRCDIFAQHLRTLDIKPLISGATGGRVLYLKDSSMIETFYGYAGMNKAMFTLIDARFAAETRRNVARISNCETNNIKKAVEAAGKQLDIIAALDRANLLSSLPDDLENTARLRLAHPDMSLAQLSAISNPPISKPGLSHRLKKIIEIGERMLHTDKK